MLELNKIYNSDCLEVMKQIPDKSIDLVITSPPYNKSGFEGFIRTHHKQDAWGVRNIDEGYNDFMPEEEYEEWQIRVLNETERILAEGGSVGYVHKVRVKNYIASFPTEWLAKTRLKIRQEIIWDRNSTPSVNNIRFYPTTEKIYWLFKGEKPKYFNGDCAIYKEVWRINPDKNNNHIAPFPIEIAKRLILALSQPDDLILDPFSGSGTTAIACHNLKRNFICIEKDKDYWQKSVERYEEHIKQTRIDF